MENVIVAVCATYACLICALAFCTALIINEIRKNKK